MLAGWVEFEEGADEGRPLLMVVGTSLNTSTPSIILDLQVLRNENGEVHSLGWHKEMMILEVSASAH